MTPDAPDTPGTPDAPDGSAPRATRFQAPAPGRVDKLVAAHAGGASRRRVAALFAAGHVRVDGRVAQKGQIVAAGAMIEVAAPPASDADLRPVPEPGLVLPVLYEDAALVVVAKPAGMPSHPLRPGETGTAANALVARHPGCAGAGDDAREAGLVHRLDTDTSGVLAAALTPAAWSSVRAAFARGAVHKRYLALVHGAPTGAGCDLPLVHRGKRMVAGVHGDPAALLAETRWRVLEQIGPFHLLECTAHTGRMHQVRVHLALAGAPIVGDATYGTPALPVPDALPLRGHFLHAVSISLPHPVTGAMLTVEAPLPADRQDTLAQLRALTR
jgi:23S rRNA pseudouridine1911/1915/1917 synthase